MDCGRSLHGIMVNDLDPEARFPGFESQLCHLTGKVCEHELLYLELTEVSFVHLMFILLCHFQDTGSHHFLVITSSSFSVRDKGYKYQKNITITHHTPDFIVKRGSLKKKEKASQVTEMQMFSKTRMA